MSLLRVAIVLVATGLPCSAACTSDVRSPDTCRQIENERCKRAVACKVDGFAGDADACIRFYDVQCGRGVPDEVKEPTKSELTGCLDAIRRSCDVVVDPTKSPACAFLTANAAPVIADGGASADAGAEASDTSSDAAADASDGG